MQETFEKFAMLFLRREHDRDVTRLLLEERASNLSMASHPLGFFRGHLGTFQGCLFYLHIWLPGLDVAQSEGLVIHCHSVDVRSYVLSGTLRDERYRWVDTLEGPKQLFLQDRFGTGPRIVATGLRGDVIEVKSSDVSAGSFYEIPWPDFHKTTLVSEKPAVTIAAFIGKSEEHPKIVAPKDTLRVEDYLPRILDNAVQSDTLHRLIRELTRG